MRSSYGNSRLVRLLASQARVAVEPSPMDFAERMSVWFNAFDAIRLQAAQQAIRAITAAATAPTATRGRATISVAQDLQRVRGVLANAIAQDPLQLAQVAAAADPGYAPFQQRHLELQRQMAQMITALREHAREALSRVSPRLRQLAMLDASFEEMLAAREQSLLPTATLLLERRFEQLRLAHETARDASGEPDDPAQWRRAGGWLHAFAQDWREALLAELDLRLEPVTGLVDALANEPDIRS